MRRNFQCWRKSGRVWPAGRPSAAAACGRRPAATGRTAPASSEIRRKRTTFPGLERCPRKRGFRNSRPENEESILSRVLYLRVRQPTYWPSTTKCSSTLMGSGLWCHKIKMEYIYTHRESPHSTVLKELTHWPSTVKCSTLMGSGIRCHKIIDEIDS